MAPDRPMRLGYTITPLLAHHLKEGKKEREKVRKKRKEKKEREERKKVGNRGIEEGSNIYQKSYTAQYSTQQHSIQHTAHTQKHSIQGLLSSVFSLLSLSSHLGVL